MIENNIEWIIKMDKITFWRFLNYSLFYQFFTYLMWNLYMIGISYYLEKINKYFIHNNILLSRVYISSESSVHFKEYISKNTNKN